MNKLARASSNCNDRRILSSARMLHKAYDRKRSIEKILVVSLKELGVKTK
jgi:hypothetical protein